MAPHYTCKGITADQLTLPGGDMAEGVGLLNAIQDVHLDDSVTIA